MTWQQHSVSSQRPDHSAVDDVDPVGAQDLACWPADHITGAEIETGIVFRAFDTAPVHGPIIECHIGMGAYRRHQCNAVGVTHQQ